MIKISRDIHNLWIKVIGNGNCPKPNINKCKICDANVYIEFNIFTFEYRLDCKSNIYCSNRIKVVDTNLNFVVSVWNQCNNKIELL